MIAASRLHLADPSSMSTRTASEALGSLGVAGPVLFSIGIVGSGLIALPVLVASLCFSVAEAAGWKSGLAFVPWDAKMFYVMISGTMFVALFIDFFPVNTVQILYWSQGLAGGGPGPTLASILLLVNTPKLISPTHPL